MIPRKINFEVNTARKIEGHDCELHIEEDILTRYINSGIFVIFRRKVRASMMISPTHPSSIRLFNSTTQLRLEEARHLSKYYYMIHPFSDFSRFLGFLNAIIFLIYLFLLPAEMLMFHVPLPMVILRTVLDLITILGIYLTFLVGTLDKTTNRVKLYWKEVAVAYLKSYFFTDVISSLPVCLVFYFFDEKHEELLLLKLIYIVKLVRLNFYTQITEVAFKKNIILAEFWNYIQLFFYVLITLLWTSSVVMLLMRYIFMMEADSDMFIEERTTIKGIYNTILALLLVSDLYYDVESVIICWLRVICVFIGALLNLLIFAHIQQIYAQKSLSVNKYNRTMLELDEFMKYKEIPLITQNKILHYIDVKFHKNIYNRNDISKSLSTVINNQLQLHNFSHFLASVEFLANIPTTVTLAIIEKLRFEIFFQGETVVEAGMPANAMYFVYTGVVAVYTRKNKEICHLQDDDHFGELALIVNEPRSVTIRTISDCKLFKLTRKDFNEAIEPFPDMLKKIKASALMKITNMKRRFNEIKNSARHVPIVRISCEHTRKQSCCCSC